MLNNSVDVSSTNFAYTVRYNTEYTNDFEASSWKTWNEISDKGTIKAVRVVTTDVIPDGSADQITLNVDMDPVTADVQAGGVNIYNALIYRSVLGTEGAAPSEPIAIRLKTGVVKGQVFNDVNRNGMQDIGETGRNGVTVMAYEAGTTTVVESVVTRTIDGKVGSYEFLGLDKNQNVDVVFMNPTSDDSLRFSPATTGGSTPTPSQDHAKAITANIIPSSTDFDKINAGIIEAVAINFDTQGGTSTTTTIKKYPNEQIMTAPTATKTGHTFVGWYTAATAGNKVTFPYTVGTTDETLYARYDVNDYTVTFDNEGATTTQTVAYDQLITAPIAPTKTGYTLKGWYDAAKGGTSWKLATDKIQDNDMKL